MPLRIARFAEEVAKNNEAKLEDLLKGQVAQASPRAATTTHRPGGRRRDDRYRVRGGAIAHGVLRRQAAEESNFRTWTVTYMVEAQGRKLTIDGSDPYSRAGG